MYLPKSFSIDDKNKLKSFLQKNNFATVISFPTGEMPFFNHLPVIFSNCVGEENFLIGHMSKGNPQWKHFQGNSQCTLIFNGANTYITPNWYRSGRDVPTWNYAVAHLHGTMELIEPAEEQINVLKQLTVFFESSRINPWEFELPADLLSKEALSAAIISFKFRIEKSELKFKLSQNRSKEDRQGILQGLSERSDEQSKQIREMMLESEAIL